MGNKNKAKSEKDKAGMERDLQEARAGLEEAMRDRANMEKNCKMAQGLIVESNQKQDELARALNDADSTKKKLLVESQDLGRQSRKLRMPSVHSRRTRSLWAPSWRTPISLLMARPVTVLLSSPSSNPSSLSPR